MNWDVLFTEGDNNFIAVGHHDTKQSTSDSIKVHYTFEQPGSPEELVLSSGTMANGNILVTARAVDKQGNTSLNYQERVYFQCLSGGTTKKNLGTITGSESITMANGEASIEVVPDKDAEEVTMTVCQLMIFRSPRSE